jgi:Xaa-Pro aminopeptidase
MEDLFANNREKLLTKLDGGVIVLTAYAEMQWSNDVAATFEQESNFWWLSGIEAPNWWIIIDGTRRKSWLVAPEMHKVQTLFDGGLDVETAKKISGVDDVLTRDTAGSMLRDLAKKHSVVFTLGDMPHAEYYNFVFNPAPKKLYDQLERTFTSVRDCRKELAFLRAVKDPREITAMKKAINLTVDAFEYIRPMIDSMKYEYEVDAEFGYYFRRHGAKGHAYDPIVAAGKNACTLHYMNGNAKLKKRELLLLDIGARYMGYPSDISRTYAIGEPTKRQQEVHGAVQRAQKQIVGLLGPDLPLDQYHRNVDEIMMEVVIELGLMKDKTDTENYRRYFPHAIGHGLGVDPHDSLGQHRYFMENMVVTVEPGIYIPEEGIGVRIEDDILITKTGHSNLSARLSTDL